MGIARVGRGQSEHYARFAIPQKELANKDHRHSCNNKNPPTDFSPIRLRVERFVGIDRRDSTHNAEFTTLDAMVAVGYWCSLMRLAVVGAAQGAEAPILGYFYRTLSIEATNRHLL